VTPVASSDNVIVEQYLTLIFCTLSSHNFMEKVNNQPCDEGSG